MTRSGTDPVLGAPHPVLPGILTSVSRRPCRILLSWSMAGGIVAGGFLVAAATFSNPSAGGALSGATLLLWALGAGAGLAHGGLLGYLARDPLRPRRAVLHDMARSLAWVVPALLLSAVLTLWISLTAAVIGATRPGVLESAGLMVAWSGGGALVVWAAWEGFRGLILAFRLWPDLRTASVVGSAIFAVLLTAFLASPPEVWFTDLQVNNVGAVVLAFAASLWIALPVAIAGLSLLHRRRNRHG